jgi:5-methylcytosine-specific restriction endonuclease McrA
MMVLATNERPRVNVADELRLALLRILAPDGRCAECGRRFGVKRLEIDHVHGRTWSARALSRPQRVLRYWTEYLARVRLRALCRSCNAIDGNHRRWREERKAA